MAQTEAVERDRAGEIVAGRYRLGRCIGQGGMGAVYAAVHSFTGKHVAVKLLSQEAADSVISLERFLREARSAATIQHPAVCEVLDAGRAPDDTYYIVLELLEGEDLAGPIDRGDLSLGETIEIAIQTLEGLAAAHARGIVHRDIKPENIFLTRDERGDLRVKLLDFGIAKRLNARPDLAATQEGMTVGTPFYMSPEQAGGEAVDARTDLWSLGAVLYHALAGRPPHDEEQYNKLVAKILTQDPPELIHARPDLPPWLSAVVQRALQRHREQRWPTAQHMATALREERVSDLGLEWDANEDLTTRTASPFGTDSVRPPPAALGPSTGVRPKAPVDEMAATMDAPPGVPPRILATPPARTAAPGPTPSPPTSSGASWAVWIALGVAAVVGLGVAAGVIIYLVLF